MRLTRNRIFLAVGALAMAGTAAATASLAVAGTASATPVAARASQVVLIGCSNNKAQVRPATIGLPGCMPANEFVGGMKWTSWTSTAFGAGTLKLNSCTPNCAKGKYINYPILMVLWRAEPWPGHSGGRYFSRMTWIYTGKRPPGSHIAAPTFNLSPHPVP